MLEVSYLDSRAASHQDSGGAQHDVTIYESASKTSADDLYDIWQSTVGRISTYNLSQEKFASLLSAPSSRVFQVTKSGSTKGFAITYLIRDGAASDITRRHFKGSLALLAVHPDYQGQGIGFALHEAALQHLESEVRKSFELSVPRATQSQVQLGSIFPRIFPGLPEGQEFDQAYQWFAKRGWPFQHDISIDLYQPVSSKYKAAQKIMDKSLSLGIRFAVPEEKDDASLYDLQVSNFGSFTVSLEIAWMLIL
jgi:beta-N-acetylhexosaminidase